MLRKYNTISYVWTLNKNVKAKSFTTVDLMFHYLTVILDIVVQTCTLVIQTIDTLADVVATTLVRDAVGPNAVESILEVEVHLQQAIEEALQLERLKTEELSTFEQTWNDLLQKYNDSAPDELVQEPPLDEGQRRMQSFCEQINNNVQNLSTNFNQIASTIDSFTFQYSRQISHLLTYRVCQNAWILSDSFMNGTGVEFLGASDTICMPTYENLASYETDSIKISIDALNNVADTLIEVIKLRENELGSSAGDLEQVVREKKNLCNAFILNDDHHYLDKLIEPESIEDRNWTDLVNEFTMPNLDTEPHFRFIKSRKDLHNRIAYYGTLSSLSANSQDIL